MIPDFYDGDNLPPGRHECTLDEVRERFGTGEKRQDLFSKLSALVRRARDCGFRAVVLFGSFVSSKLEPGDVDLFWVTNADIDTDQLSQACRQVIDSMLIKQQVGFDVFWCPEDTSAVDRMTELWCEDRQRRRRGLLMVNLGL